MTKHKVGTQEEWRADLGLEDGRIPGLERLRTRGRHVYHTYSRTAPDRFLLAPYYDQLLDQIPAGRNADFPLHRHDEY
jgi:predicted dithiol-disulfide oxidoreductase (DUF899 family)